MADKSLTDFRFTYRIKGTKNEFMEFADDEKELLSIINRRYKRDSPYTLDDIEIIDKSMLI
ncbi:MAG: hypothetical protein RR945_00390 [Erysipelotrichaceae bacterium]